MAVYDGFFDAVLDEDTGEYDRAYGARDFTNYFANIVGSGVCIHDSPDSFKVRLEEGRAVVGPGYLFIQGYWCKNDADLPIDLPGTGSYAIVAHLDLSKRMIVIEARSVSQAYPDSLVLAIVSPTSAEDTRHNTDICGIIDTAGELSKKVGWAISYIDTEIEDKLAAVERDINAQAAKLDAKIAEVQAVADSIVPPPVGSIKFSASQNVGPEWLRCDGSFINEADYPELVAALGKLTPSGDKFQLISDGEIGPQITNGVVYAGRMWVYSYSTKKLYGVDLEGKGGVKEIELISEDIYFKDYVPPSVARPLALSIVPHLTGDGAKIFLMQIIKDGEAKLDDTAAWRTKFVAFCADFSGEEMKVSMEKPFSTIVNRTISSQTSGKPAAFDSSPAVPYVVSHVEMGVEKYFCAIGGRTGSYIHSLIWGNGNDEADLRFSSYIYGDSNQRYAYTRKNENEIVIISRRADSGVNNRFLYETYSSPNGIFATQTEFLGQNFSGLQSTRLPLNITGTNKILFAFGERRFPWVSLIHSENEEPVFNGAPSVARVFVDAAAYLRGKDIFMIFVGTGIIFSRDLTAGSFGYLDTTSVLGTITQFGYLDYSQDEGTLYLLGQDTTNKVKVAKIVLDTLYDYANDGAWLPMIASDGVPAYIKAKGDDTGDTPAPDGDVLTVTVKGPADFDINGYAAIEFNGDVIGAGTYRYRFAGGTGTFNATIRVLQTTTQAISLNVNGSYMVTVPKGSTEGTKKSATLNVAPYMASGVVLQLGIPR